MNKYSNYYNSYNSYNSYKPYNAYNPYKPYNPNKLHNSYNNLNFKYNKTSQFQMILNIIGIVIVGLIIYFLCTQFNNKEKFNNNNNKETFIDSIYNMFFKKKQYVSDDPKLLELKALVSKLFVKDKVFTGKLESLNRRDIMNEIELYVGQKSYTINKKRVFMCIKDPNGNYYDTNSLIFVLVHELSHVINNTIGHDDSFQQTFDELLQRAIEKGIYSPNITMVPGYCPGRDVDDD
jgi:hypothetical protein